MEKIGKRSKDGNILIVNEKKLRMWNILKNVIKIKRSWNKEV